VPSVFSPERENPPDTPVFPPGLDGFHPPPENTAGSSPPFSLKAALNPNLETGPPADVCADYEKIRAAWNETVNGVRILPENKTLFLNAKAWMRDIVTAALMNYSLAEILNAVENIKGMREKPEKFRNQGYGNMFSFLDKALPTFSEDSVFLATYSIRKGDK
jgi:hypothetical protein